MDNQNTSTKENVLNLSKVLILVLMDNQNTVFTMEGRNVCSVLILVLMDNQNTSPAKFQA